MAPPRGSPPTSVQTHKMRQKLQKPQPPYGRDGKSWWSPSPASSRLRKPEKRELTQVVQDVEISPAGREQSRQPHCKPSPTAEVFPLLAGQRSPGRGVTGKLKDQAGLRSCLLLLTGLAPPAPLWADGADSSPIKAALLHTTNLLAAIYIYFSKY